MKLDYSPLTPSQRAAVDAARDISRARGLHTYLVGGPVRDLLLHVATSDIDIVVEEDAEEFSNELAARLGGRSKRFGRFLTYKIEGTHPDIDVATTRSEHYDAPGALPSVDRGSLEDDLLRRDFSINALALALEDDSVVDPTGGLRDLETKVLRVLHERSFEDDPTRIIRAIRLAARLNFDFEPVTGDLLRSAIAAGKLTTVSHQRLWRELMLAIDEERTTETLDLLNRYGVLSIILRGSASIPPAREVEQLKAIARERSLDFESMILGLLLFGRKDIDEALEKTSGFDERRREVIRQIATLPAIVQGIEAAGPRRRMALCVQLPDEVLVIAARRSPAARTAADDVQRYRNLKLPFSGSDLGVEPGAHVGRALDDARWALFTGELETGQALRFARERAMLYLKKRHST